MAEEKNAEKPRAEKWYDGGKKKPAKKEGGKKEEGKKEEGMHERHAREHKEMHDHHQKQRDALHEQHQADMANMADKQAQEIGGGTPGGQPQPAAPISANGMGGQPMMTQQPATA